MKTKDTIRNDALDFTPNILLAQQVPPAPLPRLVLYCLLMLVVLTLAWTVVGRLDIVAVAHGKLVPESFMKIVQPAEPGVVREILVKEGDLVNSGQVLMRMDARISSADLNVIQSELKLRDLQLRRVDAELSGAGMKRKIDDFAEMFTQVEAQYQARKQAYFDSLDIEKAVLRKAKADLQAAVEIEAKLKRVTPIYRDQAEGWDRLAREGFAGRLMALERQRSLIESEQDLRVQSHAIESLRALITQSERRISQITSNYRQQLQNERLEINNQHHKLQQELDKQLHRHALLELKAPQDGTVKDLATHTVGTVVSPGTVLLTLVPRDEPLKAEIWISNLDAGFVQLDQPVKLKLTAFPFQRYGMLEGMVQQIGADATDQKDISACKSGIAGEPLQYRALVILNSSRLERGDHKLKPAPGMQVSAEIHLGTRSVIEYLLSPIQKVAHEAGRER